MKWRRALPGAVTLVMLGAPCVTAQTSNDAGMPWEAARTATLKKFDRLPHAAQHVDPFKIVDNIFYVGLETVASYLIPTSDGLILVDATYADTADLVIDNVRKLGQDPAKIKYILVTHGHADHFGGAGRIKELTGARVGMALAEWESVARLQGRSPADPENGIRLARDLVIKDGDMLVVGDTQLWLTWSGATPPAAWSLRSTRSRPAGSFGLCWGQPSSCLRERPPPR